MRSLIALMLLVPLAAADPFTEDEKTEMLGLMNGLRRTVALGQFKEGNGSPEPYSHNMNKLIWDDELADETFKFLQKCPDMVHDPRNFEKNWGENIYSSFEEPATVEKAYKRWAAEVVGPVTAYTPGRRVAGCAIGAYTNHCSFNTEQFYQMIWAKSRRVGCARNTCPSGNLIYCKFYPAGLLYLEPIYGVGPACTKCESYQTCEDSLCVGEPATSLLKKRLHFSD